MTQNYSLYTPDEQAVWRLLFERQMSRLPGRASQAYMDGIVATGFPNAAIPDFDKDLNPRLLPLTGWRVVAVPGLIGNREFFELMADHQFPATTWVRSRDQLDYLPEPDMFHDTFGHVPVLTNQPFCNFLGSLSRLALKHVDHDEAIEMIARLYWYTVEFGLIREKGPSGAQNCVFMVVASSHHPAKRSTPSKVTSPAVLIITCYAAPNALHH